ncbi:unnamed protein product [Lota lota]
MDSTPTRDGLKGRNNSSSDVPIEGLHLTRSQVSSILTVAMCVVALLFVCLFTFLLQLIVKHVRNTARHQRQESASDYETMSPLETPRLESKCVPSDCTKRAPPPPAPNTLPLSTGPKQRRQTVSACITIDLNDYADVPAVPGQTCHYQSLNLNLNEENIYHTMV